MSTSGLAARSQNGLSKANGRLSGTLSKQSNAPANILPGFPEFKLKATVLFGYDDLLSAGCRALLGLNMGYNYHTLNVKEANNLKPKCQRLRSPAANERLFESLQILDCKYEDFSLVIINAQVPANKCHYVIDQLLTLARASNVKKIIAFSCLRIEMLGLTLDSLHENNFFTNKVTEYPALPDDAPLSDPLMAILIQMIKIEQFPTTVVALVTHKAQYGLSLHSSIAEKVIKEIQNIVANLTGLEFDLELSLSMVFQDVPGLQMTDIYS